MRELDRALVEAVRDLQGPPTAAERLWAGGRLMALLLVLGAAARVYWLRPLDPPGVAVLLLAGVAYALVLIATHEMVHGTWLGWRSLEFALGCLLGWPMAWPFATYGRLHRLHHRWNGLDPRDPERTQTLPEDPPPPTPLHGWVERHPFAVRCLLLGGVGLIVDTVWKGWRLRGVDRRLNRARLLDGAGVILLHAGLLAMAIQRGVLLRYVLFWLVLERVIGCVVQYRGLVEHHGLWPDEADAAHALPQRLRQLASTRDVACGAWLHALMGGLPHHSAHHAFPWVPTARLPEASARLQAVLRERGWPLPCRVQGYGEGIQVLCGERRRSPAMDGSG
ncbi:MAG: fatty acid desaturase [Cyanobacteriota bacterium]|nr:fatty acid desaturase [Cyanobacteriota bacterium]